MIPLCMLEFEIYWNKERFKNILRIQGGSYLFDVKRSFNLFSLICLSKCETMNNLGFNGLFNMNFNEKSLKGRKL